MGLWDLHISVCKAINVLCPPLQWRQVCRPSLAGMGETHCAMRADVLTASEERDGLKVSSIIWSKCEVFTKLRSEVLLILTKILDCE